ncbi:MAG: CHASE domain-containing protein [Vicinamibacteria bacterium]|nr:CHASE domain-containing protein [Vicinamibacteria bacterium]
MTPSRSRVDLSLGALRRLLRPGDLVLGAALLAAGLAAAFVMNGAEDAETEERFRARARRAAAAIDTAVTGPLEPALAVAGLFAASEHVDRAEFRAFTTPLLRRHPALYALEWLPWVDGRALPGLEREAAREGVAGFSVWESSSNGPRPVTPGPAHAPIVFMEPPHAGALGFDVLSDAGRRAYALAARDRGEPVASRRFRLVEDPRDLPLWSVAIYQPAYRGGLPPVGVPARRESLLGFGIAVFRVAPLLDHALRRIEADDVKVVVSDHGDGSAREDVHTWGAGPEAGRSHAWRESFVVPVADRNWQIEVTPRPGAFVESHRGSLSLALLGPLAALTAIALRVAIRTAHRIRGEVPKQTIGPYTLLRRIGSGGMGVVWEAHHSLLRRPTVVKLIAPELVSEESLTRFEREAHATSRLSHPNTVEIYDFGRTKDGVFYYAMERLRGIDLDAMVTRFGPIGPARAIHLLRQAAAALGEAHATGLVHRDVKPANVMACVVGGIPDFVKVLDFGLVKDLRRETGPSLSQEGTALGTPLYLAPEGLTRPAEVDVRLDVYALAAVGYFMLCGRTPYGGNSAFEIFARQQQGPPPPPSAVLGRALPHALEDLLMRGLAFAPESRPRDGRAMQTELARLAGVLDWSEEEARAWWESHGQPFLEAREAAASRATGHDLLPASR